jgi:hypothetical protein
VAFAIVLGLTVISTAIALVSARSNAEATRLMMQSPLAKERLISDWYVLTYSAIARTSMIARTTDETLPVTFADVISDSVKKGSETMAKVEPLLVTDEEKATYKSIVALRAKYQAAKDEVGKAKASGNAVDTTRAFKESFQPAAKAYETACSTCCRSSARTSTHEPGHRRGERAQLQPAAAADRADGGERRHLRVLHLAQHRAPAGARPSWWPRRWPRAT